MPQGGRTLASALRRRSIAPDREIRMKSSTEVGVRAVAASVMFPAGVAGVLTARRRLPQPRPPPTVPAIG